MDIKVPASHRGPASYENWKNRPPEGEPVSTDEFALFTDASITGNRYSYGPYLLINALSLPSSGYRVGIILRVDSYSASNEITNNLTPETILNGRTESEEIAALLSLCLGVRLKAGGCIRTFGSIAENDPKGQPIGFSRFQDPILLKPINQKISILPDSIGTHDLKKAEIIDSYPNLTVIQAITLLRSARLYQDAIWISESQPELSWLLLVCAIEVAATQFSAAKADPLAELQENLPEVACLLMDRLGDEEFVRKVARKIPMGLSKKFIDFIVEFLPEPPCTGSPEIYRYPWDYCAISTSMKRIYDLRSKALHQGIPFPLKMCLAPYIGEERPIGSEMDSEEGKKLAKSAPMLLHTFEYIVRNSLLLWWKSIAGSFGNESDEVTSE